GRAAGGGHPVRRQPLTPHRPGPNIQSTLAWLVGVPMLDELIRSWQNVVLHPSARSLAAERPGADFRKVWISVVIGAIVAAIAVRSGQMINAALQISLTPLLGGRGPSETGQVAGFTLALALAIAVFTFFATLVGIWINSGIYWLSARAFGARGTYKDQTYLL